VHTHTTYTCAHRAISVDIFLVQLCILAMTVSAGVSFRLCLVATHLGCSKKATKIVYCCYLQIRSSHVAVVEVVDF